MANQAAKKGAVRAASTMNNYFIAIMINTTLYVFGLFMFYSDQLMEWSTIFQAFWFNIVNYLTYSGINSSVQLDVGYETYFDIMTLNLISQALTVVTEWYWVIYLAIPAYCMYYCWGWFKMWADGTGKADEDEEDPAEAKKRAKKEKPKYKMIKR